MKIARAMKEQARIKGEIKELKKRVSRCLNVLEGGVFPENFDELMNEIQKKTEKLISMKTGIMAANISGFMFQKIAELGELKSYMDFLRELEPKDGVLETDHYSSSREKYSSQWSIAKKNKALKDTQDKINTIVDELDTFNSVTDIIK